MLEQKIFQIFVIFVILVIVVIVDDGRRHPAEGFQN